MINARFFLDNKEVIGLWMVYSIAMLLAVCILDFICDWIKAKIHSNRKQKEIQRRIAARKKARILECKKFTDLQRTSRQIRAVMTCEI